MRTLLTISQVPTLQKHSSKRHTVVTLDIIDNCFLLNVIAISISFVLLPQMIGSSDLSKERSPSVLDESQIYALLIHMETYKLTKGTLKT